WAEGMREKDRSERIRRVAKADPKFSTNYCCVCRFHLAADNSVFWKSRLYRECLRRAECRERSRPPVASSMESERAACGALQQLKRIDGSDRSCPFPAIRWRGPNSGGMLTAGASVRPAQATTRPLTLFDRGVRLSP